MSTTHSSGADLTEIPGQAALQRQSGGAEGEGPATPDHEQLEGSTAVANAVPARGRGHASRWICGNTSRIGLGVLALLTLSSVALAVGMYFIEYRADQQTDRAAQNAALSAATEGSVALLSYSPDSLDRDLAAAKSHLTGEFLTYYSQFTDQIMAPAAKKQAVKTAATVAKAAISEMHPDSAVVLLYIDQTSTSSERPEPSTISSSVVVTVNKVNGSWLIAKFEPV
ncbi:membrane protein [soil metagenome]